ncbi:MAG: hypothetical protein ACYCSG_00125, partial [Thermoplasmataceae archaeon]
MSTKFAISVWGDPLKWSEVTYIIDGTEYLKEKSSTFVIGEHFGARILAFAPATLVDACGNGHALEEQEKIVHDYVKNPFKETDFEIIVAPALGTFKIGEKIVSFKGKPDLFKIFAFYRLFQILDTVEDDLEIFVDLTYGPNYMVLANYESIKLVVSLYCALRDKKGKVTVMNTDPFSWESRNLPIRINVADTLNFDRENGVAYISDELKRKFDINKFKWQKLFENNNGSRVDTNE